MLTLPKLAEIRLEHRPDLVVPPAAGRPLFVGCRDGQVAWFSTELRLIGRANLDGQIDDLSVSPRDPFIAVARPDRLTVLGLDGAVSHVIEHPQPLQYTACMFSPDGQLLWIIAGGESPGTAELQLLRSSDLGVIARINLPLDEEYASDACFYLCYHPEGKAIAVGAVAGQNGSWLYWAWHSNGKLHLRDLPRFTGPTAFLFSPTGEEIIFIDAMDKWRRCRFPDAKPIKSVAVSELGVEFPHNECFVSDRHVLVRSGNERLMLLDVVAMHLADQVDLEGYALKRSIFPPTPYEPEAKELVYGDIGIVTRWGDDRLITAHSDQTNHFLRIWDATSLFSPLEPPDPEAKRTARLKPKPTPTPFE